MISLPLHSAATPRRVLVIGCHSDDIEIGCGGTILSLAAAGALQEVTWLVLSATGERAEEAKRSADAFLEGAARKSVSVHDFRDGFFPYIGGEVKERFEELKAEIDPDLIFTHTIQDRHQDHRIACELTWNTFRDHLILEYEIPKYDGDLGSPNVLFTLDEAAVQQKLALIREHFGSQAAKHWFDEDVFLSLMRLRGMESGSPTRFAEAFYCRKLVLHA